MKQKSTSWGGVAGWYDALLEGGDGTYHKEVILPNLLRYMSIRKNEAILDLACGTGFFSREFATAGARVTGIDISSELIALAKEKTPSGITYHVSDAAEIPMIPDQSMDTVVIVLAIQNIVDVHKVFAECARVLKPSGRLLLVMNHPTFRIPKASEWGWDETRQIEYRRIDAYLSESKVTIDMHPGEKKRAETISFHRPLQVYMKHITKAGFVLTRLEEWISNRQGPRGKRAAANDKARKEIPLFLFLEGRKIDLSKFTG